MKSSRQFAYAGVVVLIALGGLWYAMSDSNASNKNISFSDDDVVIYKNAGCKCCDKWASYLERNQLSVEVKEVTNLHEIRSEKGMPANMSSCHTAEINGYLVEGHVPVEDIRKMLDEQPEAIGLAAPGMPKSAPGMNVTLNDPYTVYLIDKDGSSKVFANH